MTKLGKNAFPVQNILAIVGIFHNDHVLFLVGFFTVNAKKEWSLSHIKKLSAASASEDFYNIVQ